MRKMGLMAICRGPIKRNQQHRVYPYLLRNVTASRLNHVWGIDITYIRMKGSWMYLVAIVDLYSRYIVSWELSQTLQQDFVLSAVQNAFTQATLEILNSDQDSHFTSLSYIQLLKSNDVGISMDSKGRAMDNIFIERFWCTLKYEEVYLNEYQSPLRARKCIK